VSAIAQTLAVARSNLVEQAAKAILRPRKYRKAGDADLLVAIRRLVDERPSYGYRRIAAHVRCRPRWQDRDQKYIP
jgi:hypothetical protein